MTAAVDLSLSGDPVGFVMIAGQLGDAAMSYASNLVREDAIIILEGVIEQLRDGGVTPLPTNDEGSTIQ